MNPVIQINNLTVSYDKKRVLSNIYLKLFAGNIYGIIGPNGAGKSTLFKAILDLIPVNSGSIEILGSVISDHRKDVVYIPQKDDIDWTFPATVNDIVLMGRYPHKFFLNNINREDRQLAENAMEELGIIQFKDRQIGALSGGQQQRVFIARALCQDASILMFDEPFVGVDQTTEERILHILQNLASNGKTLLVIHHDLSTVRDYFHRVIMINQRLVVEGATSEVFTEENINKTFKGQLNILHSASTK